MVETKALDLSTYSEARLRAEAEKRGIEVGNEQDDEQLRAAIIEYDKSPPKITKEVVTKEKKQKSQKSSDKLTTAEKKKHAQYILQYLSSQNIPAIYQSRIISCAYHLLKSPIVDGETDDA